MIHLQYRDCIKQHSICYLFRTNSIHKKSQSNIDKRAKDVGINTNQVKAFEKGLEITSVDPENYIPVFLLLTDGALDPIDSGQTPKAEDEFERGFVT